MTTGCCPTLYLARDNFSLLLLRLVFFAEAIEMFNMSINVRVDAGQFSAAAKLCLEIAEIYAAEEQHASAAEFFVKAADYYEVL